MYFGSIRFFRHLILTVLALLIIIPVFFAVRFGVLYKNTAQQLTQLQSTVAQVDKNGQTQTAPQSSDNHSSTPSPQATSTAQTADVSLTTQLEALHQQIDSDLEKRLAEIKKGLDATLTEQVSALNTTQAQNQQQLAASVKGQVGAIQQQLDQKLDENTVEILKQVNASLNEQLSLLLQQLSNMKTAQGGRG